MPERKVREESPTPPKPGELRKPKHGRGLLRHGSTPETAVAGPGRPSSVIRQKLRGSFEQRIRALEQIADATGDEKISTADRLKAIDLMGKYGIGQMKGIPDEDVRDRLRQTLEIILAELPADVAEPLLGKIETVWR